MACGMEDLQQSCDELHVRERHTQAKAGKALGDLLFPFLPVRRIAFIEHYIPTQFGTISMKIPAQFASPVFLSPQASIYLLRDLHLTPSPRSTHLCRSWNLQSQPDAQASALTWSYTSP